METKITSSIDDTKQFTKADLREAFYSSICYWSPRYGWEQNCFETWFNGRGDVLEGRINDEN